MKTKNKFVVSCLIIGGLAAFCTTGTSAEKYRTTARASTVAEVMLERGSTVTITAEPGDIQRLLKESQGGLGGDIKLPLNFQWRKNSVSIPGATKESLMLENVTTNSVGSYTLLLTGAAEAETAPVHVSVYIELTNTSGRILTAPIGVFTIQNNTISCSGTTFTRIKTYSPFPSSTYPNLHNDPKLTINTCFGENGGSMNTAVVVRTNMAGFPEHSCNDAIVPPFDLNGELARCTNITLSAGTTFRASIYLKNMGSLENVTWSYLYHP
jgi:hypothetical protein